MCKMHNPIFCVIPPYMMDKIVENGTPEMRRIALQAMKQARHIRSQRMLMQTQARAALRNLMPGVEAHNAQLFRRVYDAKHMELLPGTLVRSEGEPPSSDTSVNEAYDGAGETWHLYNDVYGRNSIDDGGMILDSTVHNGVNYNNAFWNSQQMVYGDGDEQIFTRFTIDIDVIGHELTHGVTEHEAGLQYQYQSGALNESFSDVFGSLVKQRKLGQDVKTADWLIGANVLIGDYALRSMKAPGAAYKNHPQLGDDPQPATMDGYQDLPIWNDQGGVHLNSGIPNHAFYLAAMEIGGNAWEKAGLIWYRTLTTKLDPNATFVKTARATIEVARQEFGTGSLEETAVSNAWKAVKVL